MRSLEEKVAEQDTTSAVRIADHYVIMHECDDGYDYSILDALFNMLHEDGIFIAGTAVDINPITTVEIGTLETYLPTVEAWMPLPS